MNNFNQTYEAESVGSIMTTKIPKCKPNDTFSKVLQYLSTKKWDSIRNVYVVNLRGKLLGFIDMAATVQSNPETKAEKLMKSVKVFLHPNEDQEKAVFLAVKNDVVTIPVVSESGQLLGSITANNIIDVMHQEHIEDALLTAGIRAKGSDIIKLATERTNLVVFSRAPWLVGGLIIGLGLGLISSWFEQSLQKTVAIAYFIPVVAYIADSVGAQSEAITVRALATIKINFWSYILKELIVGLILGLIMGIVGGLGAILISKSFDIGFVVGLALFAASTIAAVLASFLPIIFKRAGKDPALVSGPLVTALQDVISVLVYFLFAVLIIG